MDSLVANYASSDEEGEDQRQQQEEPKSTAFPSKPTSPFLFSSLPQPKSSSLFQSLPQPKSKETPSLPIPLSRPKSQNPHQTISNPSSADPKTKRVVLFKPPIASYSIKSTDLDDDDDEDEEKERSRRKESEFLPVQTPSVKAFLSSILPAAKKSATLGALPSSGTGRRAIVETDALTSSSGGIRAEEDTGTDPNLGNYSYDSYGNYDSGIDQNVGNYDVNYDTHANYQSGVDQNVNVDGQSQYVMSGGDSLNHGDYLSYGNYGEYGSNWADGSVQEMSGTGATGIRVPGKRGRNEVPLEVVEVKQDELMKNRPREDQAKLTGIAFGPAYQVISLVALALLALLFFGHSLIFQCGHLALALHCNR
jgi:proline-rich protein PRCC